MNNDNSKVIARDCPICYECKKIYIARMKRVSSADKYYCDGCGNTMSDKLIDKKWKAIKSKE